MDFALSRPTLRSLSVVRLKARKALLACACVAAAVAIHFARDGGPPREETRAEVSPLPVPVASDTSDSQSLIAGARTAVTESARERALTVVELEHRLSAADRDSSSLLLQEALPAMVAHDAGQIARYAELETDTQLREQLIRLVAQLWARSDVDRAMAWVTSLPDSPERQATLIDVSLTVAETDPQRAVNLRETSVGNVEADGVLEALVQRWAERDFDAALAWTGARPRNAQHDKLLQRLAYVRAAGGSPAEAARMVEQSFDDGAAKAEAAAIVARQWSQTDLVAANAWLSGLDPATARQAIAALR
jgi:hypothetical protein